MKAARRSASAGAAGARRSPWERLNELLVEATGDEERASELIFLSLGASERARPPQSIAEVLAFAAKELKPLLVLEVGHAIAMSLLSRLQTELAPTSPGAPLRHHSDVRQRARMPSISGEETRPVVFLLYTNALHRAELARTLLREGFEVRLVESPSELARPDDHRAAPTKTAVVDVEHPRASAALSVLASAHPDALVVLCAPTAVDALDAARPFGIDRFEIHAKSAPLHELEARVRRRERK